MRQLVTGANGQVGWELSRSLKPLGDVVALDRRQCELSQPELLPTVIRSIKPDVIVNAAAYTAVDKAEQEEQLATTVNGTAVGAMADESRKAGILLVHYSTDYIFDGEKPSPYTEDDVPHPINTYGRSKLAGETAMRQAGEFMTKFALVSAAMSAQFTQGDNKPSIQCVAKPGRGEKSFLRRNLVRNWKL
jgi:dTDP-4-dehydrorhamnose reductase